MFQYLFKNKAMTIRPILIPGIILENRDKQIIFFTQKLLRLLLLGDVSPACGKEFIALQIAVNQNNWAYEEHMHVGKRDDRDQQPDGWCVFSCCGNLHDREYHFFNCAVPFPV